MALTHLARAGLPVHSSRSATFLHIPRFAPQRSWGWGWAGGHGGMQGVGHCHTGVVVRRGQSVTGSGECGDEGVISESNRSPG